MRNVLLSIFLTLFLFSACGKKNPVVFSKKSDLSEVSIALDTNGTFVYEATSKVGHAFKENGTFTVEDSLVILRFNYESYSVGCQEMPLQNDSMLIMNYKGKVLLYPTIKNIPGTNCSFENNEKLMQKILEVYQSEDFPNYIGKRYFALTTGDFSLLFHGKWKVSPYYDSQLK
ncbi:MAG: hypothetical protein J6V74_05015 [Bacteroidales bacterium]|nr:hypothetical protein [Bacteroidales bacterium]